MFDLAEVLKGVSNPGTSREQIEYISLDLVDQDPNNFYKLVGIEDLAANIALCGLQQPIRIRPSSEVQGRYVVVSGHRRREALILLAEENPEQWKEAPCIVERDEVSPALQQLRLIYANANTRDMTSAEIGEQAAQVEKLLYELKEEGYEFPGRMRDHVAQAVNASKTKLARLKVIRENLAEQLLPIYKSGVLNESVAYELAKLPPEDQVVIYQAREGTARFLYARTAKIIGGHLSGISGLTCAHADGAPCSNMAAKKAVAAKKESYEICYCAKCCSECPNLISCKSACPHLAKTIQQMKAERKAAANEAAAAQEEKERPIIDALQAWWTRFGIARNRAGVSIEDAYRAMSKHCRASTPQEVEWLEAGKHKITTSTAAPYGYSSFAMRELIAAADLFGCTADYLLGRTDDPAPQQNASAQAVNDVSESGTWKTGEPEEDGTYAVMAEYNRNGRPRLTEMDWVGACWYEEGMEVESMGIKVLRWIKIPEDLV